MKNAPLLLLSCLLCSASPLFAQQPISLEVSPSVADLTVALDGPQARISNVTLSCPEGAYALFASDNTDLGQARGVLLTTGKALNAVGPNGAPSIGNDPTPARLPGDLDLDALSTLFGDNTESIDACVLEMDVVSETGEIVFDYTFGSDEYPEFANDPDRFNDIFALLISGPGISGEVNGKQNIAVLPNPAATTVQIDSVNATFNSGFFRDNTNGLSLEYDGLTTSGGGLALQARASVQACETYRLKLAIADRGDELFDSGVFVSAVCGGFPELGVALSSNIDYLLEDCSTTPDSLVITYDNEKTTPQTYDVTIGGSATLDTDYTLPGLGTTLVFQPGMNRIVIPILVVADGEAEVEETLDLSFTLASACGPDATVETISLRIRDEIELDIVNVTENDSVFFCPGSPVELTASGADTYQWSASNGQVLGAGSTVIITPTGDGIVTVIGTVGSCTETLVLDFLAADPEITILNPDTIHICLGDTVQLMQTNNVNDQNLVWAPTEGVVGPEDLPILTIIPLNSRYYTVSTGPEGGCAAADSVYVDVDRFVVPELISDTVHCGSTPLQLITNSIDDTGNTIYDWSAGDFLEDSTDVNSVFTFPRFIDTLFTLVSNAENGACTDTQMVRVEIIPSQLTVQGGMDTVFRCDDEGAVTLMAVANPSVDGVITWRPIAGALSGNTGPTYMVDPQEPTVYYAEAIVNGCPQIDSVAVRTDSLPDDLSFTVDPVKDPYCQGDTFTIKSPTYDVGDYPLITHEWSVAPGLASPSDLYNAVVFASDSALFTRVTVNGACRDTITEQINVIRPPLLIFEPDPAVVCPGEPLQINVSFDPSGPMGTLEWEDPSNTLSCTDCLDPVATVNSNTMYTIEVTAEGSECTSPSMYEITVEDDVAPTLNNDRFFCLGESRRLITGGIVPGYTYSITGGGVDSADPNVEVTPTATTTYTVTTTGDCGTNSQEITLDIADDYTLSVEGPMSVCAGDPVTLAAVVSNGLGGEFTWTINNSSARRGREITDNPTETSIYSVTFEDQLGCGTETTTFTVNVIGADLEPQAIATNANGDIVNTVSSGGRLTLSVLNFPDEPGTTYAWNGNPGFNPASGDGRTLEITAPTEGGPGSATYTVTITTAEGCTYTAVVIINLVEVTFQFPELITPNGDGTNDIFRIFSTIGASVTDYNLIVFNRWGQKIFTSTEASEGWDGTKNGTAQNQDTYLYIANFNLDGVSRTSEGQFSLVR